MTVSPAVDEEAAKKKARLARFSSDTKSDTLEEDKKKARAIRSGRRHPLSC